MDLQKRVHALHSQMIQLASGSRRIRNDLPAAEIAHVFRQTIFGTLLIWSLYGDATLHSPDGDRIQPAVVRIGTSRELDGAVAGPFLRLRETSFMNRRAHPNFPRGCGRADALLGSMPAGSDANWPSKVPVPSKPANIRVRFQDRRPHRPGPVSRGRFRPAGPGLDHL